jgi:ribose transport system ATP-binding protein
MLGPAEEAAALPATAATGAVALATAAPDSGQARLELRSIGAGTKLRSVSLALHAGEVLGVVGLEGQGQDELFEVMAGVRRPESGHMLVDGAPVRFGHPADAIAAGLVYVPANRAEALLLQRSIRENIALPAIAKLRDWGPVDMGRERARVDLAVERLQIDTRARAEVRRLSGGNQQKVTIARWIAGGVRTLLCFDPTRGIDIRTKRQIYQLLRELADAGAAVILYTSELEEVAVACDRALVILGGEIVDEMPASIADEPTLLRAAHGLSSSTTGSGSVVRAGA